MSTQVNEGIVSPTTRPSGETYGEKGIEQGDDPKTPSHPTPSPMDSKVVS